ncbi:conserved hypothetical protein [Histoplasma capsulatum H143]|uniref:Uncharacterized protein n=1 Tax=Ajellomyces capsulatus (strain H143) TaxID=544712 RepID=C6H3F4_AJECH|nr:conserved hypothetical protein [Histoplasma capsulatum H143]
MKFAFEKTDRKENKQGELRKLKCDALVFCALAYKVRDIYDMSSAHFDYRIANVADFVHRYSLFNYLYGDDVDRILNGNFEPEDDKLFKEFLKSVLQSDDPEAIKTGYTERIELRRVKRIRRMEQTEGQQSPTTQLVGLVARDAERSRRK